MFSSLVSPRQRLFSFSFNEKHFCYLENVGNFCGGCQCGAGALTCTVDPARNLATLHGSHRHGGGCGKFANYGFRPRHVVVLVKASIAI